MPPSTGFLKTRASLAPGSGGNLGVLDIIAALRWTRENIAAFGGDPSRVTIVGHDTGAALANLVLISKSGKCKLIRLSICFLRQLFQLYQKQTISKNKKP